MISWKDTTGIEMSTKFEGLDGYLERCYTSIAVGFVRYAVYNGRKLFYRTTSGC